MKALVVNGVGHLWISYLNEEVTHVPFCVWSRWMENQAEVDLAHYPLDLLREEAITCLECIAIRIKTTT